MRTNLISALVLCLTCLFVGPGVLSAQQTLEAPAKQKPSTPDESDQDSEQELESDQGDDQKTEDPEEKESELDRPDKDGDQDKEDKDNDREKKEDKAEDQKDEADDSSNNRRRRRTRRPSNKAYTKQSDVFVSAFVPIVAPVADAMVKILDDKKQIALGTIIDADGLILTKASELRGELSCELPDGTKLTPVIVGIDSQTDLVLLKVDRTDLNPAEIAEVETPTVGSWLATVGDDQKPVAIGIVSHTAREIVNNVPTSAVIGIYPLDREEGDGVRINKINNDSPAETAGLLVNDIIIGIDDDEILNREELTEKLSNYQPSDDIILKIKRGTEVKDVPLTLGRRSTNPMMNRGAQQNRMGSVLSKRKSDFPLALQHDSSLNANQMGGPIVDLSGKVVGINIARDGRVSSLALPIEVVLPIIEKLKTGEFHPEAVNKDEIALVEKQLTLLDEGLELLPDEKIDKRLEQSAGSARESELERQIKEVEDQLEKLRERYRKTSEANRKLKQSIKQITDRQDRYEERLEPLKNKLKRLKTGIE